VSRVHAGFEELLANQSQKMADQNSLRYQYDDEIYQNAVWINEILLLRQVRSVTLCPEPGVL
jgi:hypothetical protein